MSNIPTDAKKPQDHKPSAEVELEAALSEDELLADMPTLRAPGRLRLRQRNQIMKIALSLGELGVEEGVELANDDPHTATLLDILADVDDFAESIAIDPAAYRDWAEGKDYEVFTALLSRYASAVGESNAS